MSPGQLIREARRSAGLSQQALASRMGTTQSAVAGLESDRSSPRVATVERALRACGQELTLTAASPQSSIDETMVFDEPAGSRPSSVSRAFQSKLRQRAGVGARWHVSPLAEWPELQLESLLRALVSHGVDFVDRRRDCRDRARIGAHHPRPRHLLRHRSGEPRGPRSGDARAGRSAARGARAVPFVPDGQNPAADDDPDARYATTAGSICLAAPSGAPPYGELRERAERVTFGGIAVLVAVAGGPGGDEAGRGPPSRPRRRGGDRGHPPPQAADIGPA